MPETTPAALVRARAQRARLETLAAAKGVTDLRVLRYPGAPDDAPLELLCHVDTASPGRTGLELFEFAGDIEALLDTMVLCGDEVADAPAGWWVEAL